MGRDLEQITDEWLVISAQAGSHAAIEELVARWQPKLLVHARHVTGRTDVASDVVQEAWLSMLAAINRLQDPAAFRGWAYRIVHARAVDWVRKNRRDREAMQEIGNDRSSESTDDDSNTVEQSEQLASAIRSLAPEKKLLLRMYYQDQMRVHEIAQALDLPAGTLKYRLFQLREQLKSFIQGENDEPS